MDRRTKQWRAFAELARIVGNDSVGEPDVEVVDGIEIDYRLEPRCRVCSAGEGRKKLPGGEDVRRVVDTALLGGASYREALVQIGEIVAAWPREARPGYASIARHAQRHLAPEARAAREIIERRAAELGLRVAVGRGSLVTTAAILEQVRQRGHDALVAGEISPTLQQTIEASVLLDELDRAAGNHLDVQDLAAQVGLFLELVREQVGEEAWSRIAAVVEGRLAGPPGALPEKGTDGAGSGDA